MARVIISAGHTSMDPGAVNGDLKEYELTRKIANSIIPHLRSQGLITLSVPPELDLGKRIEWINNTGYRESLNDIAVEIHINDGGKSGLEGWFKEEGANKSEDLTKKILEEASKEIGLPNQGAKSEYNHELGSLAFVHNTNTVSALIECLYIDTPSDQEFLRSTDKIDLLGKGIAKGILKFLNIEYKEVKKVDEKNTAFAADSTSKIEETTQTDNDADLDDDLSLLTNPLENTPANPVPPVQATLPPQTPAPAPKPPVNPIPTPLNSGGFSGNTFGGNSMGNSFGGGLGGNSFGGGAGMGSSNNFMQSRDDRKKMVEETYQKVLGREPNQNDLNYFLNIGITEDQLTKRMIDSQEHADLVKARQEVVDIKEKFKEVSTKHNEVETRARDQEGIIKSLNSLLAEKNQVLSEMTAVQREQHRKKIKKELSSTESEPVKKSPDDPYSNYKPSLSDRIFKFFSDIFE